MGIYTKVPDPAGDKWVQIGAELPGLGGWATITEVTGTYTKHSYGDWVAYEFTDDGFFTLDSEGGLVEALIVSAASVSTTRTDQGGHGGGVFRGVEYFDGAGPHEVIVGQSGQYASSGGPTLLNGMGPTGGLWGDSGWAGATKPPYPSTGLGGLSSYPGPGVMDDILGPSDVRGYGGGGEDDAVYGGGNPPRANSGGGSTPGGDIPGAAGVCIVRVPAGKADGVAENFHGWDNYASVENGVVVETQKLPDNQPRTLSNEWLDAPAEVSVGWIYDGSEFGPPAPPSNKDLIAELEAQVEELRKA